MIKINLIWVLCLIAVVVGFGGFITFGYISSKKDIEKYSFTRHFPYELNKGVVAKIFSYLFGAFGFVPLLVVLPLFDEFQSLAIYTVFITCIIGFATLSAAAISNLPASYTKPHITLATVLMAVAFLSSALVMMYSILVSRLLFRFNQNGGLHIALAVVSGILAVLMVVVMFSPKLKDWAKLSEDIQGDQKTYSRGKFFPLAYSEWIAIGVILISEVIFLISLLSI